MVAIVNQWTVSKAQTLSQVYPPAAYASAVISTGRVNTAGNWLIAIAGLDTASDGVTSTGVSVTPSDDGHNVWQPLAISTGGGVLRVGMWAAPVASVINTFSLSPNGYLPASDVLLLEVSGLSSYLNILAVSSTAGGGTSTGPVGVTVTAPALIFTAAIADRGAAIGQQSANWSSPLSTPQETSYRTELVSYYQVTTGNAPSTFSTSGPANFAALTVGFALTGTAPVTSPNANWPALQLRAAFGATYQTPPDQLAVAWIDITSRFLADNEATVARGRQYELGQTEASEITVLLDNHDGALTPGNTASPYYPAIVSDTPVQLLAWWQGKSYSLFKGFIERWPQTWDPDSRWTQSPAVITDCWSLITKTLPDAAAAEILTDKPYAYFPCSDVAASAFAQNAAPNNTIPLQVQQSKFGAAGVTEAFGNNSGAIGGFPGETLWSQTGITNALQAYALYYQDTAMPSLLTGVTIEGWWAGQGAFNAQQGSVILAVWTTQSGSADISLVSGSNTLVLSYATGPGARTLIGPSSNGLTVGRATHFVLSLWNNNLAVYVNGGTLWQIVPQGFANIGSQIAALSAGGDPTQYAQNGPGYTNCAVGQLAVFTGTALNISQITRHYLAGLNGFQQVTSGPLTGYDTADVRMERILGYAGYLGARCLDPSISVISPATDLNGQIGGSALNNIASSDNGLLYIDGCGTLVYQGRSARFNQPVKWTIGDGPGEIAYAGTITYDYDKSQLYNDVTLTGYGGSGVGITARNTTSIAQHGDYTYTATVYLANPTDITSLAQWIANTESQPQLRISSVTIDAANNPSNWPFVLGVEVGDIAVVNRRPFGAPIISTTVVILSVNKTINFKNGVFSAQLICGPYFASQSLQADSFTNGVLDGTHPFAW